MKPYDWLRILTDPWLMSDCSHGDTCICDGSTLVMLGAVALDDAVRRIPSVSFLTLQRRR